MHRSAGWIESAGRGGLFVQVHEPREEAGRNRAVVIVPGLGDDYFHGYRALRLLADSLSECGFPCVRMDFSGCGNSLERPGDDVVAAWTENVARVGAWLRTTTGARGLCFIAHRTGALFLDQALRVGDDLVLWGGSLSGKAWIREQQALRRFAGTGSGGGFESGGLCLSPQACESLAAGAFTMAVKPRNVLVVDRGDRPLPSSVIGMLGSGCVHLDIHPDPDYPACFREPHHAQMPSTACRAIAEWLCAESELATDRACADERPAPVDGLRTQARVDAVTETPVRIDGLFGILTRPAQSDRIVLLGNAGSVHSVGPNRLNVELARNLAGNGIATLRYDLSNLGDSVQGGVFSLPDIPDENHPYPATAEQDLHRLVRWARRSGYGSVILAGLCSGAYAAFDFARSHPSAHADQVLLINPLTFDWRPGMSLEIPAEYRTVAQGHHYQQVLRDRSRWWRLLTGRVEYLRLARHVVESIVERLRIAVMQAGTALHLLPQPPIAEDLMRIAAAGTRLRFYFSGNEPGVEMLERAGGTCLGALRRAHVISINFILQADHTFRGYEQRRDLVEAITRNLCDESSA